MKEKSEFNQKNKKVNKFKENLFLKLYPRISHKKGISFFAFSRNGKRIFTLGGDSSVKVWDLETGTLIKTINCIVSPFYCVPFENYLILVNVDNSVMLLDLKTGNFRTILKCDFTILGARFLPERKKLILYDDFLEMNFYIFDITIGELEKIGKGTYVFDFTYDEKEIALRGHEEILFLDINTLQYSKKRVNTGTPSLSWFVISKKGEIILCRENGAIEVIDKNGAVRTIKQGENKKEHYGLSFTLTPDETKLIAKTESKEIEVWDLKTGKLLKKWQITFSISSMLKVTPDGKKLLLIQRKRYDNEFNGILTIFDLESGNCINTLDGETIDVISVQNIGNTDKIVASVFPGNMRLIDFENLITEPLPFHTPFCFTLTPDGKKIVLGEYEHFQLFDLKGKEEDGKWFDIEGDQSTSIIATPDRSKVILAMADLKIKIFDLEKESIIEKLSGHDHFITSFAMDSKGEILVSGSADKTVKIWDVKEYVLKHKLIDHEDEVTCVAITPDGKKTVSASLDNSIKIWDTKTGFLKKVLLEYKAFTNALAITPDGKKIVSGNTIGEIKIWNSNTGKLLKLLNGHFNSVSSLTITPDGTRVISGSDDGTVRLWDINTGKQLAMFVFYKDGEWVGIDLEKGYYNCSPGGEKYINVKIGSNEVYPASKFRDILYKGETKL